MFDYLYEIVHFITLAPWFIGGGFGGVFLLTFATIKLAPKRRRLRLACGKMDAWRAKQAAKIRRTIARDAAEFRGNRKMEELPDVEQRLYFQILQSGYERVERRYVTERRSDERE